MEKVQILSFFSRVKVIAVLTEFNINPKKVMHWVCMNLNFSGWIANPRDPRISVVFRTLGKQSS